MLFWSVSVWLAGENLPAIILNILIENSKTRLPKRMKLTNSLRRKG